MSTGPATLSAVGTGRTVDGVNPVGTAKFSAEESGVIRMTLVSASSANKAPVSSAAPAK